MIASHGDYKIRKKCNRKIDNRLPHDTCVKWTIEQVPSSTKMSLFMVRLFTSFIIIVVVVVAVRLQSYSTVARPSYPFKWKYVINTEFPFCLKMANFNFQPSFQCCWFAWSVQQHTTQTMNRDETLWRSISVTFETLIRNPSHVVSLEPSRSLTRQLTGSTWFNNKYLNFMTGIGHVTRKPCFLDFL